MSPDPYFSSKLAECRSTAEVDAMRDGIISARGLTDYERHQITCMRQHIVTIELERQRAAQRGR